MSDFESLEKKLDKWFSKSFDELPSDLRRLVIPDFKPFSWEGLSPEQRRSLAIYHDYKYDPATETSQNYWFNFQARCEELEAQLQQWKLTATPTATDLREKEQRIEQLEQEIAHGERLQELLMRRKFPRYAKSGPVNTEPSEPSEPDKLIGLPFALRKLKERLGASQWEIAAWVLMTELKGGLRAYKPQSHPEEFQRFYFDSEMDEDYLSLLFDCWFDDSEIENFVPKERFVTGAACLELLKEENVGTLIIEMIQEGKITERHPITGTTRASSPDDKTLPEFQTGLFSVVEVEKVLVEHGLALAGSLHPTQPRLENESPAARQKRLIAWHQEELGKRKVGAVQRTASREGISRQTLSTILKRE